MGCCPSRGDSGQAPAIVTGVDKLLETIELDIEEPAELTFKVKVEGVDPAPAQVRLVCEAGALSLMFDGRSVGNDMVQFDLPTMSGHLKEGTYLGRVEVLIENRYFAPVRFNLELKKAVTVVAEAVRVVARRPVEPVVKVTAEAVARAQAKPAPRAPAPVKPRPTLTLKDRYAARQRG